MASPVSRCASPTIDASSLTSAIAPPPCRLVGPYWPRAAGRSATEPSRRRGDQTTQRRMCPARRSCPAPLPHLPRRVEQHLEDAVLAGVEDAVGLCRLRQAHAMGEDILGVELAG